jgi:dipeptidyl aminopeptidase/acylaminoacyl peptidase
VPYFRTDRPVADVPTEGPDFDRMDRQQRETDRIWREASDGHMQLDKITYRSRAGDLDIPAFVFQPLRTGAPRSAPALVWVHENIRGHLYEHFIPFIRDATARGFVVIAPEYRGSIGYGQAFYDAIDYGGAEVDDVVTAAQVVAERCSAVDPARIGIIGWSHGGLIALLATFRNPRDFAAAAAIVPVSNLIDRLARKGEERQRAAIDPQNRFGGTPAERRMVYEERSPMFQIDRLEVPLLVNAAANDQDVTIEELLPFVGALRSRKASLVDARIYDNPLGGHMFDRRVDARTWQPANTPEQVDAWKRVWRFFNRKMQPGSTTAP